MRDIFNEVAIIWNHFRHRWPKWYLSYMILNNYTFTNVLSSFPLVLSPELPFQPASMAHFFSLRMMRRYSSCLKRNFKILNFLSSWWRICSFFMLHTDKLSSASWISCDLGSYPFYVNSRSMRRRYWFLINFIDGRVSNSLVDDVSSVAAEWLMEYIIISSERILTLIFEYRGTFVPDVYASISRHRLFRFSLPLCIAITGLKS